MGTSKSLTAWLNTTLSLTAFGRAGSGTALKRQMAKARQPVASQTALLFRKRKGGIPEKVVDSLPEHLRNAARR